MKLLFIFLLPVFFCGVAYGAAECTDGYHLDTTINANTFVATFGGGCSANSGFTGASIYYPIAYPIDTLVRCNVGQRYVNGACVDNVQGPCDTGYRDSGINNSETFTSTLGGKCTSGYQPQVTRDAVSYVLVKPTPKCGFGQYPAADGTCVANPTDGCPSDYYGVVPDSVFNRYASDGTCATNYSNYDESMPLCHNYLNDGTDEICTPLCDVSYVHTRADTCARKCTAPQMGELRARDNNGGMYAWQLWMDKTTNPSIHIQNIDTSDTCYMNMVSGRSSGTLNVMDDANNIYHAVDLK